MFFDETTRTSAATSDVALASSCCCTHTQTRRTLSQTQDTRRGVKHHNMELENHDLATLPDLNEEIILEYLKVRYENDIIYVNKLKLYGLLNRLIILLK